jgi:hypothetical protein
LIFQIKVFFYAYTKFYVQYISDIFALVHHLKTLHIMDPTQKSPQRAFALQKYLLLHSQHDALQKHLDHITPSLPPTTSSPPHPPDRSRQASLSSSPGSEDSDLSPVPPRALHRQHHRSSTITNAQYIRPRILARRSSLPTIIDESILGEIEEDEDKLKNVNEQIKCTLTDLLNCEGVRGDGRYRMWVQTRLMDAEKQLTGSRCRNCERRMEDVLEAYFSVPLEEGEEGKRSEGQ